MAQDADQNLETLGLTIPEAAAPAANYVPYVLENGQVYISGQIPFVNGEKGHIGKLGDDFTLEQGQEAAQACALNVLGQLKAAVGGDWNAVDRCLRLGVFVNSTADFTDHPAVANGASDLIAQALGEAGRHTRAAVGVSSLPFGVAVEIEALFSVK